MTTRIDINGSGTNKIEVLKYCSEHQFNVRQAVHLARLQAEMSEELLKHLTDLANGNYEILDDCIKFVEQIEQLAKMGQKSAMRLEESVKDLHKCIKRVKETTPHT